MTPEGTLARLHEYNEVFTILDGVNRSLDVGGQINIPVPVYPENIKDLDNYNVDFFPLSSSAARWARAGHRNCQPTDAG